MGGVVTNETLARYYRDIAFLDREKKQTIKVLADIERQLAQKRLFIHQIEGEE
ncbi:hypothetical protein [Clostridium sp.]